ncbi:MAG: YibE/F family protein [Anaerolineae bacterium]
MVESENPTNRRRIVRYVLEGAAVLIIALLASAVVALHLTRPPITYSQERVDIGETVQAQVEAVLETTESQDEGGLYAVYQRLQLRILSDGPHQGESVTVEYNGMGPTLDAVRFQEGARALVMISDLPTGENGEARTVYQVADHMRLLPLGIAALIFALVAIVVGRWQGLRAIIGLAVSGVVIGVFIMPQILAHRDPVLVTLVGTGLILAVTLYLIQGWNVPGHTALLGMLASLAVTALLAILVTRLTFLTGFGSEETLFLQAVGVGVQMRGLLLAGIILGAAGVLDDVIIAQVVAVFEVSAADTTLRFRDLYFSGMRIGVTHLASMINTLVLAYASTALPLLILFYLYPEPWHLTINRELLAEEIVRTLVGSVGLMLAVPLTTAVAAWVAPLFGTPQPVTATGIEG